MIIHLCGALDVVSRCGAPPADLPHRHVLHRMVIVTCGHVSGHYTCVTLTCPALVTSPALTLPVPTSTPT